jgi:large subunit ribosomal protein L13
VNTAKLKFSKDKMNTKTYYWHTGFPGGIKKATPMDLKRKGKDSEILSRAVNGMIPKNRVRRRRLRRCRRRIRPPLFVSS